MTVKTKPSEKILQAMEIIGSPERWTKGASARDSFGRSIPRTDENAACFCAVGALGKAKADYSYMYIVLNHIAKPKYYSIVYYNDSPKTKHKDVMNMFMTAAFLALSEGK